MSRFILVATYFLIILSTCHQLKNSELFAFFVNFLLTCFPFNIIIYVKKNHKKEKNKWRIFLNLKTAVLR